MNDDANDDVGNCVGASDDANNDANDYVAANNDASDEWWWCSW